MSPGLPTPRFVEKSRISWAKFLLVPTVCGAMILGLTGAYLLLTKLTD